jgi:hypothetical protein
VAAGLTALVALGAAAILLVLDFTGGFLRTGAHSVLSSLPLALIALAYLVRRALLRPSRMELLKALLLASAFLSWSAYQLFPLFPQGAILNDLAIGLFVLDVVLVQLPKGLGSGQVR